MDLQNLFAKMPFLYLGSVSCVKKRDKHCLLAYLFYSLSYSKCSLMLNSYHFLKTNKWLPDTAFETKEVSFKLRFLSARVPIFFNFILRKNGNRNSNV